MLFDMDEGIEATREAVAFVLNVAATGGTAALASVLLHCYNTADYPFNITELRRLDAKRQKLAWAILQLRVHGRAPHTVLKDPNVFEEVVRRYGIQRDE